MGSNQSECCGVKRAEPFDCCGPKRAQPVVSHPGAGAAACFLEADPDERGSPLSVEPSEPPSPARTDRKGNPILPRELTPSGLTPHHISILGVRSRTRSDPDGRSPSVLRRAKASVGRAPPGGGRGLGFAALGDGSLGELVEGPPKLLLPQSQGRRQITEQPHPCSRNSFRVRAIAAVQLQVPTAAVTPAAPVAPSVAPSVERPGVDSLDAYLQQREKASDIDRAARAHPHHAHAVPHTHAAHAHERRRREESETTTANALLSEQQDSEALLAHRTWHFKRLSVLFATLAACALAALALATEQPFALRGKECDGIQYSDPIEVDVDEATKEFSTPLAIDGTKRVDFNNASFFPSWKADARCILCNPNQCTLDLTGKGAWTSCPASQKYFSEAHCKCVSSCSSDPSPIVSSCRLCQNCYTKTCNIGGKYLKCGATTPYWEPNKQTCASACQQGPNVAPAPTPRLSENAVLLSGP
eukprot:g21360.t1